MGATGANISTEITQNIDGRTFEPCQEADLMPALHYYTSLSACEARALTVTQFLPFLAPQTCYDHNVTIIRSNVRLAGVLLNSEAQVWVVEAMVDCPCMVAAILSFVAGRPGVQRGT